MLDVSTYRTISSWHSEIRKSWQKCTITINCQVLSQWLFVGFLSDPFQRWTNLHVGDQVGSWMEEADAEATLRTAKSCCCQRVLASKISHLPEPISCRPAATVKLTMPVVRNRCLRGWLSHRLCIRKDNMYWHNNPSGSLLKRLTVAKHHNLAHAKCIKMPLDLDLTRPHPKR